MYDRKDEVREELAQTFKEILKDTPVEKITVKMITDKTGILRPTFYKYFQDKYEIIEWIFDQEIRKNIDVLVDNNLGNDVPMLLFRCIDKNKEFYRKTFTLDVPQSIEHLLDNYIKEVLTGLMNVEKTEIIVMDVKISKEVIIMYMSAEVTQLVRIWLESGADLTPEELSAGYQYLKEHSISEILELK